MEAPSVKGDTGIFVIVLNGNISFLTYREKDFIFRLFQKILFRNS